MGMGMSFSQHVRRENPCPLKRFLTMRARGSAHVAFHVSQPGTSRTRSHMAACRTYWQILSPYGAHFTQFRRIAPDINEFPASHISAGQRELHARKNISVGSNVSCGMPRAARIPLHDVLARL